MRNTKQDGRKEAQALTLLVVLLCLGMLVVSPDMDNVSLIKDAPWWRRVVYVFCHANVVHLGMNVWAILYLVFLFRVDIWMLLLAVLSAMVVPDILIGNVPTVGLSGVVFFILGGIVNIVSNKYKYLLSNFVFIAMGLVLPHIAWGIHLWCFLCGLIYAYGKCKVIDKGKR